MLTYIFREDKTVGHLSSRGRSCSGGGGSSSTTSSKDRCSRGFDQSGGSWWSEHIGDKGGSMRLARNFQWTLIVIERHPFRERESNKRERESGENAKLVPLPYSLIRLSSHILPTPSHYSLYLFLQTSKDSHVSIFSTRTQLVLNP